MYTRGWPIVQRSEQTRHIEIIRWFARRYVLSLVLNIVSNIEPVGFRPPHRNTVTRSLKRLKNIHLKKLVAQLKEAQSIAITTDFWTDQKAVSYICLTGHFFSQTFDLKSKVLVFAPYHERHTAVNISSELELHLKNLKIYDKTTSITCDGASNMRASFRSITKNIKRVQCFAHKLHLIICNALGLWVRTQKQKDEEVAAGEYSTVCRYHFVSMNCALR